MQTQNLIDPQLFTKNEACAFINIGRTKLAELIADGELKAAKIGTKVMIRRTDLEAYVERLFNSEDAA